MEKRIALFGAGDAGRQACEMLGRDCVACFIDNHKQGETVMGIPVFGFEHILENHPDLKVIVASFDYWREITAQLENNGIHEYLIWQRGYAAYTPSCHIGGEKRQFSLSAAVSHRRFDSFSQIAVYAHGEIADLVIFLLYAYGATKNIQWLFRNTPSSFFHAPPGLKQLFAAPAEQFASVLKRIDCLVIAVRRHDISFFDVEMMENAPFPVIDFYDPAHYFAYRQEIAELKKSHYGKRCFIVGNGPSLRVDDLDALHKFNEITFGCNKIYKIFDRTIWRPTIFVLFDGKTIAYNKKEIFALDLPLKMFINHDGLIPEAVECLRINHCWEKFYPNAPRFATDPGKLLYSGENTIYECLQLAAYMGFNKIYLLGVDNTLHHSDFHNHEHFMQDYITPDEADYIKSTGMLIYQTHIDCAFRKAELHSRAHGYRIFNATRGGRLEAFERVCFDDLF